MKVNVAVCGAFHYRNYIRYLDRYGVLNRFFYSHRVSTNASSLGIDHERAVNLWLKEYLVQCHSTFTRNWLVAECAPAYASLWEAGAMWRWKQCEILHVMLHGTALRLIQRAKAEGAKVIGEAVNQHPEGFNEILVEEADRRGVKTPRKLHRIQTCQLEEVAHSDFLLAPSRIVRESHVQCGYEFDNTFVIPYGVDSARFCPSDDIEPSSVFRVICVAQVSLRKGQFYLLEAWRQLALQNAELLLIGSVSYEVTRVLEHYDGVFRHISFVPNHQLVEYYGSSFVFVLPTLEDGFAVATGEALACGLPVITTVSNGASDVITHGHNGFVVEARSPEAIASCLELLYRDRELRASMSKAAAATARTTLSWETYARELCMFYAEILARPLTAEREEG